MDNRNRFGRVYTGADIDPQDILEELQQVLEYGLVQSANLSDGVDDAPKDPRIRTLELSWIVTDENEHLLSELPFDNGLKEGGE